MMKSTSQAWQRSLALLCSAWADGQSHWSHFCNLGFTCKQDVFGQGLGCTISTLALRYPLGWSITQKCDTRMTPGLHYIYESMIISLFKKTTYSHVSSLGRLNSHRPKWHRIPSHSSAKTMCQTSKGRRLSMTPTARHLTTKRTLQHPAGEK